MFRVRKLAAIALLLLPACNKSEGPDPKGIQVEVTAATKTPTPTPDAMVLAKTADMECKYVLKDVLTESLGDQLAAGHTLTVEYTLKTSITETGTLAYALTVDHVKMTGKREDYALKVDSSDYGQMVRVRGGADTLLMFDGVLYFALVGQKIVFEVGENGNLLRVQGGAEARAAYLAMHPKKPRSDHHHQAKVAVALSDDALARRFLPFASLAHWQVKLQAQNLPVQKTPIDWAEFPADSMRGARMRWVGDEFVLEEKRAFAPSLRAPKYPAAKGFPKISLRSAQDQTTVGLKKDTPCFTQAATTQEMHRSWTGLLEEAEVTTTQVIKSTWIVRPASAVPPDAPASQPKPAATHPAAAASQPSQ